MLRGGCKKRVVAESLQENLESTGEQVEVVVPSVSSETTGEQVEVVVPSVSSETTGDQVEVVVPPVSSETTGEQVEVVVPPVASNAAYLQDKPIVFAAEPSLSVSWRSSYDDKEKRQVFENRKLEESLKYLREQIKSGKATRESLYSKFNYPSCYDIEFIKLLAQELNADISGILSKKRVAHEDVLNELISQLI